MVDRDRLLKVGGALALVALVVLVVGAAVAVATFEQPQVTESRYAWGTVSNDTTEIRTTVVVDNPNPVGVPGVVNIAYTAKLNDVTLATGERRGVGFGTGETTIDLSTE